MQNSDGRASRVLCDEHSQQESSAKESAHLQTLCEIITETPLHFEDQVSRLLQEGLTMLRLDLGIVSKIQDNSYTVLFFSPSSAALERGQILDLNTTFCAVTFQNQDVVDIDDVTDSPYSGHPCYSVFGLESYIGVPLFVEDTPYGTLHFSSTIPRSTPFSDADRNFVRLMGRWIETCLTANIRKKELQTYRNELEILVKERTIALKDTNQRLRQEIVENQLAQKTLIKQQSFLNTLIDTIPIAVFYKDTSRRYLGCNKAFELLSQRPRSEIIGKTVFDRGPSEIAEKYDKKDRELLENPGSQQYEWKFIKNNGEERAVIFQKATFKDEKGNIAGLVGSIFDITEKNKIDKQLSQAQKLQAIGTLSNGIAHDFNNILSAMMGYTELARMKLSEESQIRKDLGKVLNAGKRAVELVKQRLSFSRKSDQNVQPIQIGPIIEEVLKLQQASLPAMIKIRSSIRAEVTILADPTHIHQVLMNLCTNAGHAMMAEGGVLEVTLDSTLVESSVTSRYSKTGLSAGHFMKLQVKDTGTGIPQNIVDQIFDPFFSTKPSGEGIGLGLSIVHSIIKDLGGTIHVTSTPGSGSVFEILVPMATEISEIASLERKNAPPHGSEHILFVDDEELLVDLGKRLLEKLGYSVTGCTSSIEARTIFRDNPHKFDLVITDETMPKLTGTMLAAELHQLRPETPIILCSGLISSIDQDKAAAIGIKAFILKPILTKKISKTVRQVLDGAYSGS
ncbi:MAG: response regulator [Desulfobulbaceae bacterium]|nr:response regulator [Desulfobulbaceae bacterium]